MLTKQKTIGKGSCGGELESKGTQESCSANLWFMVMGLVSGLSLSNCCGIWSRKTHLAGHSRTVEYSLLCQRVQGESVPNKDPVSERPSFMPPITCVTGYMLATSLLCMILVLGEQTIKVKGGEQ